MHLLQNPNFFSRIGPQGVEKSDVATAKPPSKYWFFDRRVHIHSVYIDFRSGCGAILADY